jgi:Fe-S-cluster-containing hydrogenase component 2
MACSFVHKGEFAPAFSSMKIIDRDDQRGFNVLFIEGDKDIVACDGCSNDEKPLCVQYCPKEEDLLQIIKEFIQKKESKQDIAQPKQISIDSTLSNNVD